MAIYDFEAPDGRIFSFERDTMPTKEELSAAYNSFLKAENKKQSLPQLSPELKAQPHGNYSEGILSAGLRGFGEGALSGLEAGLNAATLGAYDWANRNLGGNAEERRRNLQAEADAAGVGRANRAANLLAEFGGGLGGAPRATAALGSRLLGSRLWNLPAYAASGAADAGIMSSFNNDFSNPWATARDAITGGALGGAFGLGGNLVLSPLNKMLSANAMTRGMRGGLNNVADNPEAVKVMRSGIKADDAVAQEFLSRAPEALRQVNNDTADLVNNALSRRINVPRAIARQKSKYRDFMEANAGQEVLDFSPKPQLDTIKAESSYNPNKKLSREEAEALLRDRAALSKLGIYNDDLSNLPGAKANELGIHHFLGDKRRAYVRTLHNTLGKPDLRYSQNGKNYAIKKYTDNSTGKDFYDFVVLDNGELFNKFPTNSNYVANRFSAPMQDVSLHRRLPSDLGGEIRSPRLSEAAADNLNINPNGLVVNRNLPHISTLYDGLTSFQSQALDDAIARGAAKTTNKLGTLDSLNRIKQELNADIIGSQQVNPANRLSSLDTPDTVALRDVKQRIDRQLGEALKGRDKGYHKAKSMEEAYNAGWEYNPNNVRMRDYVDNLSLLDRNAFAQGLLGRATYNPLTNRNLAKDVTRYENTLRNVLPENRYGALMSGLGQNSTRFGRLANLINAAENRLQTPEGNRLFLREQLENPLSTIGAIADESVLRGRKRALSEAARNLMNPDFIGTNDSWLTENYPTLSAYLSGMFAAE